MTDTLVALPLNRAVLCLEDGCERIFDVALRACPTCGSEHFMPLDRPQRPARRLLAVVTDSPRPTEYLARCTSCAALARIGRESLPLVALTARTHAIETGHVVHLLDDPARLCRCGRVIEPALEYEINDPAPLRTTCRACADEEAA